MAESNLNGSSDESLPLSQQTFDALLKMMELPGREEMYSHIDPDKVYPLEPADLAHQSLPASSSLPAISNWPGEYSFKLLFKNQEKVNKHINWTYSQVENKLYVRKDAHCPFSFQTNTMMPKGVFLRAMAVYSCPDSASAVVTRCVNHSTQELLQGKYEAEHLIRSESHLARYEINEQNLRHSVVVPFENPPIGQDYSTYIFSFVCFNSCAGGPNRRPLTLIFTLELGSRVLGRIALDLKICACPGRDRENKEKEKIKTETVSTGPSAKKRMSESNKVSLQQNFFENFPKKKKSEVVAREKKDFIIKVKDEDCYFFLKKMKRLYLAEKKIDSFPHCEALFQIFRSSSEEECDRSN